MLRRREREAIRSASTRTRRRNTARALYFSVERRQIVKALPYEREDYNVERGKSEEKKSEGIYITKESEEIYHDLFSGDVFTHIYTHVCTHVWLIILLLTCQIYVKAIWTTDVRGCSESLPWNVKEYTEVCVNE